METNYNIFGECRTINGEKYFSNDFRSDGFTYGHVYWNQQAFMESPDEVCYIPEHAFDDIEPVKIDGKDFYPAEMVGGYTRRQLEELVEDETDEDEDPIDVECFFNSLFWCCPETRLNELAGY